MSTESITVADYLLRRLQELHLDKVFQVPGDYVKEFMTALDAFEGIDAVGDVTELGAGYAADGYARLKGIGAVSVQYGVGTFSVLNAIAGAYVERVPIVVITASPSLEDRKVIQKTGALFHHATGDLKSDQKIFEPITVAAEVLSDSAAAPAQIDLALEAALLHQRPIYLEAWQNVWGEFVAPPKTPLKKGRPSPSMLMQTQLIAAIEHQLRRAKRPLLILGIELSRLGLQQAITELIETLNIPYTTTLLAKSLISESQGVGHTHFIGTFAGDASCEATLDIVNQADCILALGAIFTDDYLSLLKQKQDQLIRVNMCQALVGSNDPYLHISLTNTVEQLMGQFQSNPPTANWAKNVPNGIPQVSPKDSDDITYEGFFALFQQALKRSPAIQNSNLILGESSSLYMAARLSGFKQNHFISDAAWGSLGHETGCAIGVSMASHRQSIVVAGDGGFMMMCQALSTLARHRSNNVIFVMSNQVYAIEQAFIDLSAFTPDGQFTPYDELAAWNYRALAEAFNTTYFRVDTVADLTGVLDQISCDAELPTLVEVNINKHDLAPAVRALASPSHAEKRDHAENSNRAQSSDAVNMPPLSSNKDLS